MSVTKLLGFDLCPRLRDLAERKLFLPRGFTVPEGLEAVTVRRRRIGPAHFSHINFCGTMRFGVEKYAEALVQRGPRHLARVSS